MTAKSYVARSARERKTGGAYWLAMAAVLAGGFAAMVSFSGCGVSAEFKKQIGNASAIGQARIAKWKTYTEEQKLTAFREQVFVSACGDFAVNGRPVPDAFADLFAAEAAPVTTR